MASRGTLLLIVMLFAFPQRPLQSCIFESCHFINVNFTMAFVMLFAFPQRPLQSCIFETCHCSLMLILQWHLFYWHVANTLQLLIDYNFVLSG